MRNSILLILFSFVLYSCPDHKVDTRAVQEEMKNRELTVLKESDILAEANFVAERVIAEADTFIVDSSFNDVQKMNEYLSSFRSKVYKGSFSLQVIGQSNLERAFPKEKEIYDAYSYAAKSGQIPQPNIILLEKHNLLLYNALSNTGLEGEPLMWSLRIDNREFVKSLDRNKK